jgi:hypothetical protein
MKELHLKDISVNEGPVGLSAKEFVIILNNTLIFVPVEWGF